jgi:hypothetical protein
MVALVVAPRLRVRTWRHITPLAAVALSRGFAVAAAERTQLHIVFGAAGIPHPEKADRGGEDAYFADDAHGAFGVADGVGGSASATVDPGLFSREMLRRCHEALRSSGDERPPLTHALQAAAAQKLTLGGSSTLLVGQVRVAGSNRPQPAAASPLTSSFARAACGSSIPAATCCAL